MRHPNTQTDIPALLEREQEFRKTATNAIRELIRIYGQLEGQGKKQDRQNFRDSRYRRARHELTSFLGRVVRTKRVLTSTLAALDGIRLSKYTSPDVLIAEIQKEDDEREARNARREAHRQRL